MVLSQGKPTQNFFIEVTAQTSLLVTRSLQLSDTLSQSDDSRQDIVIGEKSHIPTIPPLEPHQMIFRIRTIATSNYDASNTCNIAAFDRKTVKHCLLVIFVFIQPVL